jgi:hypothetical protein
MAVERNRSSARVTELGGKPAKVMLYADWTGNLSASAQALKLEHWPTCHYWYRSLIPNTGTVIQDALLLVILLL